VLWNVHAVFSLGNVQDLQLIVNGKTTFHSIATAMLDYRRTTENGA
jgi:hypothetical protein